MRLTRCKPTGSRMEMLDVFRGYDHNERIAEGSWYDEENMTAAAFPALSTRRPRRTVRTLNSPGGLLTKDALAVVEGPNVVYNGHTVDMGLTAAAPKQLLSMGAYLLIWPDKKYLNTQDFTDRGSMENAFTLGGSASVTVKLCRQDGAEYGGYSTSAQPPEEPGAGDLWMDTSNDSVPVLKEWSADSSMWVTIPTTYVKLSAANVGQGFSLYDGVTVSGLTGALESFNGSHVLYAVESGYIVIPGIMTAAAATQQGGLTVKRAVPDMDYVTECGNRIWGCKYGMVEGKPVNEIYASKLGDFKNWSCYMGLSTDSYAASRGSDGVFTGAFTHLGHPLFFRENCIEKVYPSDSGAHQVVTVECRGVQRGCWRSLAIVGETLYYKSRSGVCAYTGSLPEGVSAALGDEVYDDARAGAVGELYYLSMRRSDGTWHLFTYDTARRIWHREDGVRAMMFAVEDGAICWIDEDSGCLIFADGDREETFTWSVTSGVMGFGLAENEYVSRFVIRCDTAGTVALSVRYDEDGPWLDKGSYTGRGLGSFVLPVAPRRCDHLRIRLSGDAPCRIYSIAKWVERGSDVMR